MRLALTRAWVALLPYWDDRQLTAEHKPLAEIGGPAVEQPA